jgi:hypothetical protein
MHHWYDDGDDDSTQKKFRERKNSFSHLALIRSAALVTRRASLYLVCLVALTKYVRVVLDLSRSDSHLGPYVVQLMLVGRYDYSRSSCFRSCVAAPPFFRRQSAFINECFGACGIGPLGPWTTTTVSLASLGMLELQWDQRTGWFALAESGLSYWVSFPRIQHLADAWLVPPVVPARFAKVVAPMITCWLSSALTEASRAVVIGSVILYASSAAIMVLRLLVTGLRVAISATAAEIRRQRARRPPRHECLCLSL